MRPYHFRRLFKQSPGFSPHRYLLHWGIVQAEEILADEILTVKEISQRVGFGSTSHFTALRKRVEITPREYRLREAKTTSPIPRRRWLDGASIVRKLTDDKVRTLLIYKIY